MLADIVPEKAVETDLTLIHRTFAAAAADPTALAATFYRHLFAARPDLRAMFGADLAPQQGKLASMLAAVVASLHDWPALEPTVADLGRRHMSMGIRAEHFPPVAAALIAALGERSGAALDPHAEAAWRRALARIADTMIRA